MPGPGGVPWGVSVSAPADRGGTKELGRDVERGLAAPGIGAGLDGLYSSNGLGFGALGCGECIDAIPCDKDD